MKKSAIYLRRTRDRFIFILSAIIVSVISSFIFMRMQQASYQEYSLLLSIFAVALTSLTVLFSTVKGGIDANITIYHRLLTSYDNENQLLIYNLSCQDLLIFSIYLNIKNKGGWYIHNSIEKPIKLKTLDNIKIRLTNDDMSNVGGNAKNEQLSLITSFGKVKSRTLGDVLMTQEEIRASIIEERDLYSPPKKDK